MPRSTRSTRHALTLLVSAAASLTLSLAARAQEVTLKVHHFLPAGSYAQQMFIQPWCDKVAKESANRVKCQIYPSMQLGGTPPQLIDQLKDGTVDVIWTLPGYTPGRFPRVEVFELPFMMQSPEATSKALWDYVQQFAPDEFKGLRLLATHVHGDGVFHLVNKPIKTLADFKGLKLRAPTRQTNKLLAALGATPVAMPVPAVGEALAKGVIDGAVVPYEVVPAVKIQELVKPGDPLLVQITRGPVGHKGPALTTRISLPGRYVVLLANSRRGGVSRRIDTGDERDRMRSLLTSVPSELSKDKASW